jgi:hypothetical protein
MCSGVGSSVILSEAKNPLIVCSPYGLPPLKGFFTSFIIAFAIINYVQNDMKINASFVLTAENPY